MKRIAIVVPRCHHSVTGGAEALGWQYARLLASNHKVDVLTSTARDYVSWDNELPAGVERRDGVAIHRFEVARGRSGYFHDLHRRLMDHFQDRAGQAANRRIAWPDALQEEFIRAQGPNCPQLLQHLRDHGDSYDAVIFLTYLYPLTFDGVRALGHRRWALVPTLHDEPPAYMPVIAQMARAAPAILWNTTAEKALGKRLWNHDIGPIVAMAVATEAVLPAVRSAPYILYCGRIDSHKGCGRLLDAFAAYKARQPASPLQLVLTGHDVLGVGKRPGVDYLGFVDEQTKFALMAGALAFVHPSAHESLSIVALEAMAQATPIIVNAESTVLAEHVERSGTGQVFHDDAQLHAALDQVQAMDTAQRSTQGEQARRYVLDNYARDAVRTRLVKALQALGAA